MCVLSYFTVSKACLSCLLQATPKNSLANPDPNPDPPDPHVLALLDPDPLDRGMDPDPNHALDPDPSIIKQI
jgi:hypothetical protein